MAQTNYLARSTRFIVRGIGLCLALFALQSCTNQAYTARLKIDTVLKEQTGQDGRSCIKTSDIRGYGVDDDVLRIDARRTYYVATTLYRCHDLDFAPRAFFDSRSFETCAGTSYVVTRDTRCPIKSIFEFENREQAFEALRSAEARIKQLKNEQKQLKEHNK